MRHRYSSRVTLLLVLFMLLLGMTGTNAQVATNSGSGLAPTYASLAAAITALNSATISAPVVITLTGNETAPLGGFSITQLGGTATNTITIQGSSSTLTAFTPQTAASKVDAVIKIVGGDYITIQNFTIQENSGNTVATLASNTMTEFGIALFGTTVTNGAQNNTIQNNVITMGSGAVTGYQNAIGIFASCVASAANVAQVATSSAGTNSNNKIYSNTISGVQQGVYFLAPSQTATVFESGNDVGGSSLSTANNITVGKCNTAADLALTTYTGTPIAGVYMKNDVAGSIKYNTISTTSSSTLASAGVYTSASITGITYTQNISYNTITLTNVGITAMTGISFGAGVATGTIIGSNNNITINQTTGAANSAALIGITAAFASLTNTLDGNTIVFNQNTSLGALTSAITGITAAGIGTTVSVTNNTVTIKQNAPTGTGSYGAGAITYISTSATSATVNMNGNTLNTTGSTIRYTGTLYGLYQNLTVTALVNWKNNIINIDRVAATGTIYGAYTSGTPSEVADSITGNTITFTNLAGTSLAYGIASLGGASATTTRKGINNNTISISGTATGTIYAITIDYSYGRAVGNNITVSTAGNSLYGIYGATTATGAYTFTENTISLSSSTLSGTAMIGIYAATTGPFQIYNNTFSALNFTGIITGSPVVSAIQVAAGTGNNIYNNVITNISVGAATSSGSPVIDGILISGGATTNVYKNKIYGITTAAAGISTTVNGIRISGGGTTGGNTVYNNIIGGLTAPAAASVDAIRGISITSTTAASTNNVYFNSVYLNAVSTGVNFGTSGIYHAASATATVAALNLRNNIIDNSSTPNGTGLTVAFRRSSGLAGTLANYASTSNNNVFYAGTPGATKVIYYDGASTGTTFDSYKNGAFTAGTVSPRDGSSVSEFTTYLSTTGSSSNFLHVDLVVPTQIESGATTISGITDDYDGDVRNVSTPDIGADEFAGTLSDQQGPSISYTLLGNAAGSTERTLTVTISDGSGVPVDGAGLPTLYYKVNVGGTYSAVTGTSIGSDQYQFTFGSAATVIGDVVYYYIVAQDLSGRQNTSCYPSGGASGFSVDPPAVSTPPTTPSSYTIIASISGTKTVGATGDYATLTAAVAALNSEYVTGPVTFSLLDATYAGETFPIVINANSGASATNTITIKPASGVTATISGSSAVAIIKLNGADYVTIDGSNNGSTSRNLTIANTYAVSATNCVVWIGSVSVSNSATYDVVKNCNLTGSSVAGTVYTVAGVLAGSGVTAGSAAEAQNRDITIQNNLITAVQNAVYYNGNVTTPDINLTIQGNTFGSSTAASKLSYRGVGLINAWNYTISHNTILGVVTTTTSTSSPLGLGIYTGTKNGTISFNTISDIKQNYTASGYSAFGIYLSSDVVASATNVYNNIVSDITSYGSATVGANGYGIVFGGGGGYNVYYNTVAMYTNQTSATGIPAAVYISSSISTANSLDIRNNVFYTNQSVGAGAYGMYCAAANTVFLHLDNNIYYGANATIGKVGYLGSAISTIADWKIATGKDVSSLSVDPLFQSSTNFVPQIGSPVVSAGVTISGITTDYLGALRSVTTPSLGAYENAADVVGPVITYTALTNTTSTSNISLPAVTITDGSGVNTTAGSKPRLYYKKSTNANTFADNTNATDGWKFVEAAESSSPFSFTMDNALLSGGTGVAVNDIIQYFVVAEDLVATPNVSVNTATFTTTPTSVALLAGNFPVTSPRTYTILPSISGTKTIGATGADYATITAAVTALNAAVATGPVVFSLIDANYSSGETFPITINSNGGASATNTITFKPALGVTPAITGSSATGVFIINGADHIIFDGSNTVGGTSRNMTITNSNIGTSSAVIWIQSVTSPADGATYNTIKNLNIAGSLNTQTLVGIGSGNSTISITSLGVGNSYNNIVNNNISKTQYGIYSQGASAANKNTNNTISQNLVNTASPDNVAKIGIQVGFENLITISQNIVSGMLSTGSPDALGIAVGTTGVTTSTYSGNEVTNATITSNSIGTVVNSGTYSAVGLSLAPATSGTTLIANNVITGVNANGTSGDFAAGILLGGGVGSTTNVYYNSVSMSGTIAGVTAAAGPVFALAIGGTDPIVVVKDNVFSNTQIGNSGSTAKFYAIATGSATFANLVSNYNDLYISALPTDHFVGGTGSIVLATTTTAATLADWNSATGQDAVATSKSVDPLFQGATNLIPQVGSPILAAGTPVSVTTDYLGNTRSVTNPSMGAYEIAADIAAPTISYTTLLNTTSTANRTLSSVTITDATGLDTRSGSSPRLYYKKSSNASTFGGANDASFNGWKWAQGTGTEPTFSFAIDNSLLYSTGAVASDDIIQYFVVAQDIVTPANVGAIPSSGFAGTSVSAVTSAPTTPNQYKIVGAPMSGDYTISAALFNKVTGHNLVPGTVVKPVTKLVARKISAVAKLDSETEVKASAKTESTVKSSGRKVQPAEEIVYDTKTVMEPVSVYMENGVEYTGSFSSEKDFLNRSAGKKLVAKTVVDGDETAANPMTTFATITAAIAACTERGIGGPVRLLLADVLYSTSETFPLTFDFTSSTSPTAVNTLTLLPASHTTTAITGSSATSIIKFKGADYVTINGSNAETTSRDLTISNTSTGTTSAVIWIGSASVSDAATYDSVKNCIITGNASTTTGDGIFVGSGTTIGSAAEAQNLNITIQNNLITRAQDGIDYYGFATTPDLNLTIQSNTIGSAVVLDKFGIGAIMLHNVWNYTVAQNTIHGVVSATSSTASGILVSTGTKNGSIYDNSISDIKNTSSTGWGSNGIQLSTLETAAATSIYNNFIFDVASYGYAGYSSTDNGYGIVITAGGGYNLYYNTILMNSNQTVSGYPAALNIYAGITALDIRNNIIYSTQTVGGSTVYGVYSASANTAFTHMDYNNYNVAVSGTLGYLGASAISIAGWRTLTGGDVHSVNTTNAFTSATDLHLAGASIANKTLTGTPIAGITTDIDGNTRHTVYPYMGADEVANEPLALSLGLTVMVEGLTVGDYQYQDTAWVYLRNTSAPYAIVDSASIALDTNGTGSVYFRGNSAPGASYYLAVSHRNSIETWSAAGNAFTAGSANYNFTTDAAQAFGSNMVQVGTKWCMFSGDVFRDAFIDNNDLLLIDNDAYNFVDYWTVTDLNGDRFLDNNDLLLCDNNAFNFIGRVTPLGKINAKPVHVKAVKLIDSEVVSKPVAKPVVKSVETKKADSK